MRSKLYKVEIEDKFYERDEQAWNGRDSDELHGSVTKKVKTRTGSWVTVTEIDPSRSEYVTDQMKRREAVIGGYNKLIKEHYPEGIEIKVAPTFGVPIPRLNDANIAHKCDGVDNMLEAGVVYLKVHVGIRGWYITEASTEDHLTYEPQERFEFDSLLEKEDLPQYAELVEGIIAEMRGKKADSRYSFLEKAKEREKKDRVKTYSEKNAVKDSSFGEELKKALS